MHSGSWESEAGEPPESADDWDAQDWESYWSEPVEPVDSPTSVPWDDEDDPPEPAPQGPSPVYRALVQKFASKVLSRSPQRNAAELDSGVRRFPETLAAWDGVNAVKSLRQREQPYDAIRLVHEIIMLQGAGHISVEGRARAALLTTAAGSFNDLGRYDKALHAAANALRNDPGDYFALRAMGNALSRSGDRAGADECFAKAKTLEAERKSRSAPTET
jgi:tetratricopeptide (TPR) repeat protein